MFVTPKYYLAAVMALLLGGLTTTRAVPDASASAPDLEQVRQLIRANLTGITDAELDQYACAGLLQGLRGKVKLMDAQSNAGSNLARSAVLDSGVGYVRVRTVALGLADEVAALCQTLAATNDLKGIVIDLRFAEGDDYLAAATVANLFIADERELLDWGNGMMKSTPKTNALNWPVAVIINNETIGAPEALAALFRETGVGLLLGNTTRGAAMTAKEFPLANGQRLRIASLPVKLAGETALPPTGITPDIQVAVSLADERTYLNDPFKPIVKLTSNPTNSVTGTNRVIRRTRTTEADLVRARREGINLENESLATRESEPEPPFIRDPVLARAVDLLKGLAVVRRNR